MSEDRPSGRAQAPASRRGRPIAWWGGIALVVLVVLAGSSVYTDQSSFCPWCHEMRPYYDAWRAGPHATAAQCVDCHVDPGIVADVEHKAVALKEVWDHFFGTPRFPDYPVDVPNARCERCHASVPQKAGDLFSHAFHASKATCRDCHATAGHQVALSSLASAGVLRPAVVVSGGSQAASAAHSPVVCRDCHDLSVMKCTSCHQAPHEPLGVCSNCHSPSGGFGFTHPTLASAPSCGDCHALPAEHIAVTMPCATCHRRPGVSWAPTRPPPGG